MRESERWRSRRSGPWPLGMLFSLAAVLPVAALEGQDSGGQDLQQVQAPVEDVSSRPAILVLPVSAARLKLTPPGGHFESAVVVSLEANLPGEIELRYTTDGQTPTLSDALYQTPLVLAKSTALRAGAFREGRLVSPVASASYFVDDALELPVMSFVMDPDDFRAVHLEDEARGRGSERAADLDVFEDGRLVVSTGCGLRLHGGASRSGDLETKKSYRCYFRGVYGAAKLEYPVIPDTFVDRFEQLVLRAGFNDSFRGSASAAYLRDQIIRDLHEDMGMLVAHGSWLSVFVNMKWRGVFNVVERLDEQFLKSYTGDPDWDVIKTAGEVQAGDAAEWTRLQEFLRASDLIDDELYQEAARLIDIENFTSYVLVNIWAQNHDWPHNNWYAARPRRPDGKWIFLCWDGEFGVGLIPEGYDADTFEFIFSRRGFVREILESLLENAGYREYFVEEADRHRYGALGPDRVLAHVRRLHDLVEHDMDREAAAFGRDGSDWADNIRDCVQFARHRGPYFLSSIAMSDRFDFPEVTTPRILRVSRTSVLHTGDETITVSGVRLSGRTEFYLGGLRAELVERRAGRRYELRVPFDLRVEGPVTLTAAHPVTRESSAAPELVTITFPRPAPGRVAPTSGSSSGGEIVRITGSGFLPGAAVWFGGTPALQVRLVGELPQVLEAVTPAGVGTVDIVVLNQVRGGAVPAEASLPFEYRDGGFVRGDVNGDGKVGIGDGLRLLGALTSHVELDCASAADVDDSGVVDLTDGIQLLGYLCEGVLVEGRATPAAPFPACGIDATPDALGCGGRSVCAG